MRHPTPPLDQPFSLYLDVARFLAALAVVSAHYLQNQVAGDAIARFMPDMGREAVIVFFVLSGFVIAYTTQRKNPSAHDYVLARCTRIYSVAMPILLLGFACAAALPDIAGISRASYQLEKLWLYLPLHLMFVGQSWTLSEVPPLLAPYWSLCFEVWYYVLFGVAFYLRSWIRVLAVAAVLGIMGVKLWLLLPVWLSGVALYHAQARRTMPQTAARIGLLLSLTALALYSVYDLEGQLRATAIAHWPYSSLRLGSADRFLADYLVCLIVLANFWCARFANLAALVPHRDVIQRCSSYTFTLYLAHMIVLLVWLHLYPHDRHSLLDILGVSLAIAAVTVGLGQITEHRKELFRIPFAWLARSVSR